MSVSEFDMLDEYNFDEDDFETLDDFFDGFYVIEIFFNISSRNNYLKVELYNMVSEVFGTSGGHFSISSWENNSIRIIAEEASDNKYIHNVILELNSEPLFKKHLDKWLYRTTHEESYHDISSLLDDRQITCIDYLNLESLDSYSEFKKIKINSIWDIPAWITLDELACEIEKLYISCKLSKSACNELKNWFISKKYIFSIDVNIEPDVKQLPDKFGYLPSKKDLEQIQIINYLSRKLEGITISDYYSMAQEIMFKRGVYPKKEQYLKSFLKALFSEKNYGKILEITDIDILEDKINALLRKLSALEECIVRLKYQYEISINDFIKYYNLPHLDTVVWTLSNLSNITASVSKIKKLDLTEIIKYIHFEEYVFHYEENNDTSCWKHILPPCINDLDLSVRTYNCFKRAGLCDLEEILDLTMEDLTKIRNLKEKSIEEIISKIRCMGYIDWPNSRKYIKPPKDMRLSLNVKNLGLPTRSLNCLKRAKIDTVEDLLKFSLEDLIEIPDLGKVGIDIIKFKIHSLGFVDWPISNTLENK